MIWLTPVNLAQHSVVNFGGSATSRTVYGFAVEKADRIQLLTTRLVACT